MNITIAHMHNLDGSEWNATIRATVAEILEARATMLRLHCTLHKTMPFGHVVAVEDAKAWTQWPTCSGQICGRGLIERRPEEFPESIVAELERVKAMNAIRLNQFMYALVLPRRRRRKGHKGVFFEEVSDFHLTEAQILDLRQCNATTKQGARCARRSHYGRRCGQHRLPIEPMEPMKPFERL